MSLSAVFTRSDLVKNRLTLSVSTVDVPTKSRTQYNGNASLERYRHANLLGDSMNLHFLTYFLFSRGVSSNRRWPWPLCFLIRWAGLLNLGISDKGQKATNKTERDRNNGKLLLFLTWRRCCFVHRYIISILSSWIADGRVSPYATVIIQQQYNAFRHISLKIKVFRTL